MNRPPASASPDVVAVAGPNGAGKSTVGARLLEETLGVRQFVNADDIARGLAAGKGAEVVEIVEAETWQRIEGDSSS